MIQENLEHRGVKKKKNTPIILRNSGRSKKQTTAVDHLLEHLASEPKDPFKAK